MSKYLDTILARCRGNFTVFDAFTKANSVINDPKYHSIMCSVSGGADSDVMLDMIHKVDEDNNVRYVWFNTGLEYQATKDHLEYLEDRYNIKIERIRAIKPIPLCCKEYGQPFLSKDISDKLSILQYNNFQFEDLPYEDLAKKYPKCKSALKWWCNKRGLTDEQVADGKESNTNFNINQYRWLKEFLIENPPKFKISRKCCDYSKKKVSKKYIADTNCDLKITGIRKAEGGVRLTKYKNCYSIMEDSADHYRPLFWFSNEDKEYYEKLFNIVHSDCYKKWGFIRTGCVGCPYNLKLFEDLGVSVQYEPNIVTACNNIFKDSYEYTRQFKEYARIHDERKKGLGRLF